ncbi:BatA domain-containing protein [Hymenobacter sublimis]|uniref:BatA domain-containing protein n=1 Tax=Hymenobacter sublimis TaxID=2933777 RepID=A0ABY4J8X1_9BACT|nr:BatA domain-containing protein [Hymenobacter sublimis]UPL49270.1 BatA domain-containing protein [Hymenobacter sublimis]
MPHLFFQHATAGWLALLGLVVPLAIYLWNRRPGRVVQVGSVRWLEAAANRRLRNIRPEQLLLFLLRAGILGLLALALAGPAQRQPLPPLRGQVLLSAEATPEQVATVRPVLDSLRRRGFELRRLGSHQPIGGPVAWATVGLGEAGTAPNSASSISTAPPTTLPLNLWSAAQQAADSLPNRPLVVVAPLTLASFAGTRPSLPAAVQWVPLPLPDSVTWPVAAWRPHPDSLGLLLASGGETGIAFRRVRRSWPATSGPITGLGPGVQVQFDAEQQQFTTKNARNISQSLPFLNRPPRLAVSYDAAHASSARVLVAALRAAGSVLPLPPQLAVTTTAPAATDSLDWLFWLRDSPVPASWSARVGAGLRVWQEARGGGQAVASSFSPPGSAAPIRLLRLDTTQALNSAANIWPLATGQPLLSLRAAGTGGWYHLRTRLDPTWSELADSPELPALFLPLLLPRTTAASSFSDPRPMPLAYLQPGPAAQRPTVSAPPLRAPERDLAPWVVGAAGVLFGLERLLASRRPSQQAA